MTSEILGVVTIHFKCGNMEHFSATKTVRNMKYKVRCYDH